MDRYCFRYSYCFSIPPPETDLSRCMQSGCSQSQTLHHAFFYPAISTTPAFCQPSWIRALSATSITNYRCFKHFKLSHSFNNVCMSSKAVRALHHLSLLPLPPLHMMPICAGWKTQRIRKTAPFLSFRSHFRCPSRSVIRQWIRSLEASSATYYPLHQTVLINCSKHLSPLLNIRT